MRRIVLSGTGPRAARRPGPDHRSSYWMPASVQALAYAPVQMSSTGQKPSATIVSATFSLVTATGS